mmetsp:Transcript_14656/g.40537  ORF Transcript_14656/g.40537 Transcript_14656/m.40537 type:complete len:353 (-) Transcript_14656:2422-3480(-)
MWTRKNRQLVDRENNLLKRRMRYFQHGSSSLRSGTKQSVRTKVETLPLIAHGDALVAAKPYEYGAEHSDLPQFERKGTVDTLPQPFSTHEGREGGNQDILSREMSNDSSAFFAPNELAGGGLEMSPSQLENEIGRRIKALRLAELFLQGSPRGRDEYLNQCGKQDVAAALSLLEEVSKNKKKSHDEASTTFGGQETANKDDPKSEDELKGEDDAKGEVTLSSTSTSSPSLQSAFSATSLSMGPRAAAATRGSRFPLSFSCGSIPEEDDDLGDATTRTCCGGQVEDDGQRKPLKQFSRKMKLREIQQKQKVNVRRENASLGLNLFDVDDSWSFAGGGDITWDSDSSYRGSLYL